MQYQKLDDTVLEAAKRGERDAVSAVVGAWHRPIRAFLATMLLSPQDADDVAQELFLRALDRLDRVSGIDALGAFLRGIARNVVRERQRKYARENRAYMRFVEDRFGKKSAIEEASWLTDPEMLAALRSCLANLPEQSREMLAMRYTDETTSGQIGQKVGMTAAAVRTAMRRARAALLKCIQSTYGPAARSTWEVNP